MPARIPHPKKGSKNRGKTGAISGGNFALRNGPDFQRVLGGRVRDEHI